MKNKGELFYLSRKLILLLCFLILRTMGAALEVFNKHIDTLKAGEALKHRHPASRGAIMAFTKGNIRLNNQRAITRVLQQTINELMQNPETDTQRCRAICYACSVAIQSLEKADFEQRLEALEKAIGGKA